MSRYSGRPERLTPFISSADADSTLASSSAAAGAAALANPRVREDKAARAGARVEVEAVGKMEEEDVEDRVTATRELLHTRAARPARPRAERITDITAHWVSRSSLYRRLRV